MQKRASALNLSLEARSEGLLSASKRGGGSATFEETVAACYADCLLLVDARSTAMVPLPCLYCDKSGCLLVREGPSSSWCSVFVTSIKRQWSGRCLKCFAKEHFAKDCEATFLTYYDRTCQHCMSPTCSYIRKAAHDQSFNAYKSAACPDPVGFALADRAKNVIFRISRDQATHAAFCSFVRGHFEDKVAVPPFDEKGWSFFLWCFDQVLPQHEDLHHVLHYNFVLLFWLSDANKSKRS